LFDHDTKNSEGLFFGQFMTKINLFVLERGTHEAKDGERELVFRLHGFFEIRVNTLENRHGDVRNETDENR
jgi:hypothetical protein